jgi:biopolymer transport protein ExbD
MLNRPLSVLGISLLSAMLIHVQAAEPTASSEIRVTLKSDGEHCVVRDATILCSDLAAHLRDTLKLPRETMVYLRAGQAAPYQSVRKVLDIIEKSGFKYPVALLAEPKPSKAR